MQNAELPQNAITGIPVAAYTPDRTGFGAHSEMYSMQQAHAPLITRQLSVLRLKHLLVLVIALIIHRLYHINF